MDKDLAAAMMLERCACYDRALDSARKVLEKSNSEGDEAFWARKIVTTLGEQFLRQRFAGKAMECYRLLVKYAPDEKDGLAPGENAPFEDMGPLSISVSTRISKDVHEMLSELKSLYCNKGRSEAGIIREGIYLVILKHATDKKIRELIFDKMQHVIVDSH